MLTRTRTAGRRAPSMAIVATLLIVALHCRTPAPGQEARNLFREALEGSEAAESGEEGAGREEHLETDRDSFTPATTVVGHGVTLLETSYSFIDNRTAPDTHSVPELLTRIGLSDWFELRLGWNYETGGGGAISGSEIGGEEETAERETETKVIYGFKVALLDQDNWVPRSALIVHATTPTSGPETATQFVNGYVAGWTLPNGWDLDGALRYVAATEEDDHFNQWAPSVVLKVPFGEHWNAHAEYFGVFTQNRADDAAAQYFSPGVHYLISPDCEVGARVGWGLSDDAADFFSNVGLGARF